MGCLPEIAMYQRISRFGAPVAVALPVTKDGLVPETRVPILEYIKRTWTVLTRSHQNLAVAAADPEAASFSQRQVAAVYLADRGHGTSDSDVAQRHEAGRFRQHRDSNAAAGRSAD